LSFNYWRRDGRQFRLFFAQLEAAETIIFLTEARADFLQGIDVPSDEPSDELKDTKKYSAFRRYSSKMATGTGKTTVMGMRIASSFAPTAFRAREGAARRHEGKWIGLERSGKSI
jgi:type III restriction enzyme